MARTLHCHRHHFSWDNQRSPALEVEPGDQVHLVVTDASDEQITSTSTTGDIGRLDFARVNPVTGPLFVHGAEPGDALELEVLGLELGSWGWTGIIPGFGLLAKDFPEPFLTLSHYDIRGIEFLPGILLPIRPFIGTIGVAPAAPGVHSIIPPRRVGGNLDCRDIVRGARVLLPVEVAGAKLSIGDTHAAQGDGEVCGTAIETSLGVLVRIGLSKNKPIRYPRVDVPAPGADPLAEHGTYVTMGVGPDLMVAAADAIREMIDHLVAEYRLSPEQSYCLCSVAVHLRLSEVVDLPNYVVSAHLPKGIFR